MFDKWFGNKEENSEEEAKKKLEAMHEENRLKDERIRAQFQEMKKKHAEITEGMAKSELEEKSHQISDMWSGSISRTLSKPIFAEKDHEQIDHENEIDKLILADGKELAEYLIEKKKLLDEAGVWPSKDDRFTGYALFKFGLLPENPWPDGRQV